VWGGWPATRVLSTTAIGTPATGWRRVYIYPGLGVDYLHRRRRGMHVAPLNMMSKALLWERYGKAWNRYGGLLQAGEARALSALIRDPIDEDARDTKVFELTLAGDVSDMDSLSWGALRPKTWTVICGQPVYIVRLSPEAALVYDDALIAYRVVCGGVGQP
jgi:hypothetical protein